MFRAVRQYWPYLFIALGFAVFVYCTQFVLRFGRPFAGFSIPAESNLPTLIVGDTIYCLKVTDPTKIAPGEIVVFQHPSGVDYVKRVIAMGGQRVGMKDGVPVIDGAPTSQRLVDDFAYGVRADIPQFEETLANGVRHEVLDLRQGSSTDDMPETVVPAGHVFVLGDNRDNSLDSREPYDSSRGLQGAGPVPMERIKWNRCLVMYGRGADRFLRKVD